MLAHSRTRRVAVRVGADAPDAPPMWPILATAVGIFLATLNLTKVKGP